MCVFFCNDTATTEIYTLSLHDALPISERERVGVSYALADGGDRIRVCHQQRRGDPHAEERDVLHRGAPRLLDRKSTRLNSSHANISYAVFCLKKKINTLHTIATLRSLH